MKKKKINFIAMNYVIQTYTHIHKHFHTRHKKINLLETAQFKFVFFSFSTDDFLSSLFFVCFLSKNAAKTVKKNGVIRMIVPCTLFGVVDATDSILSLTSNCNCVERYTACHCHRSFCFACTTLRLALNFTCV